MITAKQATTNANKSNKIDEANERSLPEFKRISKFVDDRIRRASKAGRHSVFLTKDEISDASGIERKLMPNGGKGWIEYFWFTTLEDVLKEKGFRVKSEYLKDKWGIYIRW